jgi:hypothetical protein
VHGELRFWQPLCRKKRRKKKTEAVFQDSEISVLNPEEEGVAGYRSFMERYTKGLSIERAAVENM